jgi:ribonucleoside-diphosphate reductase alpha chain
MPGEIFIRMAKTGSTVSGMLDAFAISVSLGLQHGVPLQTYVEKFSYLRFVPDGYSGPQLRFATSVLDYIFRWMSMRYLQVEVQQPEEDPGDCDGEGKNKGQVQDAASGGDGSARRLEPSKEAGKVIEASTEIHPGN